MLDFSFDRELRRCPWTAIDPEAFELVRAWELWTTLGILPYGGTSMGDQPAYIVEAFELCELAAATMRAAREARARDAERRELLAVLGRKG